MSAAQTSARSPSGRPPGSCTRCRSRLVRRWTTTTWESPSVATCSSRRLRSEFAATIIAVTRQGESVERGRGMLLCNAFRWDLFCGIVGEHSNTSGAQYTKITHKDGRDMELKVSFQAIFFMLQVAVTSRGCKPLYSRLGAIKTLAVAPLEFFPSYGSVLFYDDS